MSIPTRSNQGSGPKSPVQQYGKVKDGKIQIGDTAADAFGTFSTIATRFFLYCYDKKTGIGFESTEYNLKSENVAMYRIEDGSRRKVWTGSVDDARAEKDCFDGSKLMAGMSIYTHLHNAEKPIVKIQLQASGRNEFMNYQAEQANKFPDFDLSTRETLQADRAASKGTLPDFLPSFTPLTAEQGLVLDMAAVNQTEETLTNFWMGGVPPQATAATTWNQTTTEPKPGLGSDQQPTNGGGDDLPF